VLETYTFMLNTSVGLNQGRYRGIDTGTTNITTIELSARSPVFSELTLGGGVVPEPVPLPSAAWMGVSLIVVVGLVAFTRKGLRSPERVRL